MNLFFYQIIIIIFIPLAFLKLIFRSFSNKSLINYWPERFSFYNKDDCDFWTNKKTVWIHAVSVGETNAIKPLIDEIIKRNNKIFILVTHGTLTGRKTPLNNSKRVIRKYLPYDAKWAVKKFLKTFSPNLGMIVETEIWPNLFFESKKIKMPLFLVNGRLSNKSLKKYLKIKNLTCEVLNCLEKLYVQTENDKKNFLQITNQNIILNGNTKFDYPIPKNIEKDTANLIAKYNLTNKFIILAASTRDGEEKKILDFYKKLNLKNIILLIVPRHPQRFDSVEKLIKNSNYIYVRKSSNNTKIKQPNIILGDTMGEMYLFSNLANFIIMGGSINNFGSQNPLEGLALNKPVAIGPSIHNFKSIIDKGSKEGIFCRFKNLYDLKPKIQKLNKHPNESKKIINQRKTFFKNHMGATNKLAALINQYLL